MLRRLADISAQGEAGVAKHGYAAEVATALSHTDAAVVVAALDVLGGMGDEGAWYADAVASQAASKSAAVRCASITTLGLFGSASHQCAAALFKGLNDNEEAVRAASIVAIGQVGIEEEMRTIAGLLEDKSPVIVAAACQSLGLMPSLSDDHIASIAKRLGNPETRYAAVASLADIGYRAISRFTADIIKSCLQDHDSMTRNVAAAALGEVPDAVLQSSAGDIKLLLKSDHVGIRCTGALVFGYLGEQALEHAGDVAALLEDDAEDLSEMHLQVGGVAAGSPPTSRRPRCAALAALGMMRAEQWAHTCAKALSDDRYEVRLCALECLSQLGEAGGALSLEISGCLQDNTVFVRAKACEVIGALRVEDAMTSLPDVFNDRAPSVRVAALYAIACSPVIAESFASEILKCTNDQFPPVQAAAIMALGNLGHVGHPYASTIASMLGEDEDISVRCAACEALGRLGAHGAAFAEDIAYYAELGDPALQAVAMVALELMKDYEQRPPLDMNAMLGDAE